MAIFNNKTFIWDTLKAIQLPFDPAEDEKCLVDLTASGIYPA